MGGAVSTGRDNNDLVDNLVESQYIKTDLVERVFRAVDRADYFLPASRHSAYKDLAFKFGSFHLSAPCIYSDVMEWLKLKSGLSFLNLGSGTGYLSTMAGLILGVDGINHGVELNPTVVTYAIDRLEHFILNSTAIDEFDFCQPKFVIGNCLCLSPSVQQYDRVYCGAACPKAYENYLKNLIKVGGILVMPLEGKLLQIKRKSEREWTTKNIQHVSFASLKIPSPDQTNQHVPMVDMAPLSLQSLCRSRIRKVLRDVIHEEVPSFRVIPLKSKKPKSKSLETYHVRSISIPVGDDESDADDLSLLHDLDRETGSREMNALLNLVLSMERDVDLFYDTDESVNADVNASEIESSNPDRNTPGEDTDKEKFVDCKDNNDASPSTSNTTKEIQSTNHPVAETSQSVNEVQSNISSNKLIDNENKSSTSKSKDNELLESNDTSQVQNSSSSNVNQRRQKFDSGIVDVDDEYPTVAAENSGSSPDTTTSEHLDITSSEEYLGDNELLKSSDKQDGAKSRRTRRQRKRHYTDEEQDADGEEGDSSEVDSDVSSNVQSNKVKKMKRKSPPPPHPYDVQRQEFSNLLKEKINKLPLPLSLKKFVNMNREF